MELPYTIIYVSHSDSDSVKLYNISMMRKFIKHVRAQNTLGPGYKRKLANFHTIIEIFKITITVRVGPDPRP